MPDSRASAPDLDRMASALASCPPALNRALDRGVATDFPRPKPPEARIALLRCVSQQEGATVRQAADALLTRPNNVSTLVSQLTDHGLLERRQDTDDRRIAHVYPTARARREPASGVPAPVADGLRGAGDAVAMGVAPVSGDMDGRLRAAVVEGSGQAFMNGVHTAAAVTGILCLPGAALAATGSRGVPRPAQH